MVADDVEALACSKSYGNPSGHSSLSACFFTALFLMIFHDQTNHFSAKTYWFALSGLVSLVFNVGLSRILLGVHSFNQVLYGWSYGVWLALVLHTYARPWVFQHVRHLMFTPKLAFEEYLLKGTPKELALVNYGRCALVAGGLWLAICILSWVNVERTSEGFDYDPMWIERILQKCEPPGKTYISPNKMFEDAAFIKTGLVSAVFGAYFGLLIDSCFMGGTRLTEN